MHFIRRSFPPASVHASLIAFALSTSIGCSDDTTGQTAPPTGDLDAGSQPPTDADPSDADAAASPTLSDSAIAQVHETSAFFLAWYTGRIEQNEENYVLADYLTDDFVFVLPNGQEFDKETTLALYYDQWGARDTLASIVDEKFVASDETANAVTLTYEERQTYRDGKVEAYGLVSEFVADETAPNGVRWKHAVESILP